jgi:hypothetical protein
MIEYAVLRLRQALQSLFGFGVTVTCHLAYLDPGPEPEVTKPPQEGVPFAPVATIGPSGCCALPWRTRAGSRLR